MGDRRYARYDVGARKECSWTNNSGTSACHRHRHRLLLLAPAHSRARRAPRACSRTQNAEAVPSRPHEGASGPPWPRPPIYRSGPGREPWRARSQKARIRDLDSAPGRKGVPWAGPRGSPRRKSEGLRDLVLPLPERLESPGPLVCGATCRTLPYSQPIFSQGRNLSALCQGQGEGCGPFGNLCWDDFHDLCKDSQFFQSVTYNVV